VAKNISGKSASKSVTKVEHQGREYTTQADIESVLLPVNEAKIRASEESPFMQMPLLGDFGYRKNTTFHEQVLQGTYLQPPTCDLATATLLQGLRLPPQTPADKIPFQPHTHITTDDHIKGWKRQKEKTSGGISGLHFGHYKAHITRRPLADLDASMRSLAYSTGYSYRRWKKGIDVQLLKKAKDYRASKLRTILLLEPDHNINNKALGLDAMQAGERLNATQETTTEAEEDSELQRSA
jgi:hypothetical protein